MGKVLAIATRTKTKAPMDTHSTAKITFDHGVEKDSRGRKGSKRQVTVLTKETWDLACKDLNIKMPWTTRRANIFIEGFELEDTTGRILKIGDVELEITGELDPCKRMDDQFLGLTAALTQNWRGGVTCKVLSEGEITAGDNVELI